MDNNHLHSSGSKCPFYSTQRSDECGMTKGGMYIPLPVHVKIFCLAMRFPKCPQYVRGYELIRQKVAKSEGIINGDRRKLLRFAERLSLTLISYYPNIGQRESFCDKVSTLDMSLGGVRIEGPRELAKDSLVNFEFGSDSSSSGLSGVGEVKWCESQKGSDRFEAGIAFSDLSSSRTLEAYLHSLMV